MVASWVLEEMQGASLNDKRLNKRLEHLLSALGSQPNASIPAACGGFNEMCAAYRFFDNEKVTFDRVLAPHAARTLDRISAHEVVLLIQDTTQLDFTRPQTQMEGSGPLDSNVRQGAFLHPLIAFTPDGVPLGTCWSKVWTRSALGGKSRQRPLEQKESVRWVQGLEEAQRIAEEVPAVQCVCMADSEGDLYEFFASERPSTHWLIRACRDRALQSGMHLRSVLAEAPVLFNESIRVRAREPKIACDARARRKSRSAREAVVEVRARNVILRGPNRPGGRLADVSVNVVQVREVNAPAEDAPVEWLLLTSLPIERIDQVRQIIEYYRVRFMIEVFFRTLKSGCRVEERRFEHIERMLPCVALYLIVAWRTMMLAHLGRTYPALSCEAVFEPSEWKSLWMTLKRKPLPAHPPSMAEIVVLIAQLGGYVTTRKEPPGPQTIWLGLQRMYDLALAWNTFGPGAARDP